MAVRLLNSVSSFNPTFRVSCGELVIDDLWSVHSELEIGIVRNGSFVIRTSEGDFPLKKGDFYFIAPNQRHKFEKVEDGKVEVVLLNLNNSSTLTQEFIPSKIIKNLLSGNCTKFFICKNGEDEYDVICDCFDKIFTSEIEKGRAFYLLATGKFYEIFYYFLKSNKLQILDVDTQGKKDRALRKITEYINDNYCEIVTLDSIAKETGLSRYYISHLFKEIMNTTFIDYLNELRLSRAATLLTTTDTPIIEIAGLSGFNNISNFNRAFKMSYKVTPSKYRKLGKNLEEI